MRAARPPRVDADVLAACGFMRAAANRLLPDFLAERYELIVETRPVEDWFKHGPLRLMLRPHGGTDGEADFQPDDVADGFRLWLQLALLEAGEQTGRARSFLYEIASDWWGQAEAANDAIQREEPDADELADLAKTHEEQFEAAVAALRGIAEVGWVTGALASRLALRPAGDDVLSRAARDRRFFVVDEPERHLHPKLQREAARWLSETSTERAAPALLATHATAFLSLPAKNGLTYVYCWRDGTDSRLRRFSLAEPKTWTRSVPRWDLTAGSFWPRSRCSSSSRAVTTARCFTRAFASELADAHIAVGSDGGSKSVHGGSRFRGAVALYEREGRSGHRQVHP